MNNQDEESVYAVIVFNDNVTWSFPNLNLDYKYRYLNGFKSNIPLDVFNFFNKSELVKYAYIEPEYEVGSLSNDDLHWGVDHTEAERMWGGSENAKDIIPGNPAGEGVKVGIIDSGIDYTHINLNNNYKGGYDFASNNFSACSDTLSFRILIISSINHNLHLLVYSILVIACFDLEFYFTFLRHQLSD